MQKPFNMDGFCIGARRWPGLAKHDIRHPKVLMLATARRTAVSGQCTHRLVLRRSATSDSTYREEYIMKRFCQRFVTTRNVAVLVGISAAMVSAGVPLAIGIAVGIATALAGIQAKSGGC